MNNSEEHQKFQAAGIDKISVWIHPYLISDQKAFHPYWSTRTSVNLRLNFREGYTVDFQAEFFNPMENYFLQIIDYLVSLSGKGILKTPPDKDLQSVRFCFITMFSSLFNIKYLEIHFDFKKDDLYLPLVNNSRFKTTRYSNNYNKRRKSVLIAYDRTERLKHVNQTKHKAIDSMPFTWRIEFKLNRYNCNYLAHENLTGNFDAIFDNYVIFMANRWATYGKDVAVFTTLWNLDYADYFKRIVQYSQ
jgi:hypothetical protein